MPGNYDDAVRASAEAAAANGWTIVSDTSWPGYDEIPRDVMQGYGVIADELVAQADARPGGADALTGGAGACPWTHVILQGGVGGLAAGIVGGLCDRYGERRPQFIVVEPEQADCLLQSAIAGRPARARGSVDSVMAGLACGEVSPAAWEIVSGAASSFVALDDRFALDAVRLFADAQPGDPAIVSGETGAVGLAALLAAREHGDLRALLELDATSRVLLLGSEGDTDPDIYQRITGRSAAEVMA